MKKQLFVFLALFSVIGAAAKNGGRFIYNEKVYLTTDKDVYRQSDSVRIKGFVVDSWEHKTDETSRYLYVELVNNTDDVLLRRKIKRGDNGFMTTIVLDTAVYVGNYYLRGYTQPMKYLAPEYIFTKPILVDNGANRNENEAYFKGEILTTSEDYRVEFFPEGGGFVVGTPQRVVFKCADKYGLPTASAGIIVGAAGDTVACTATVYNGYGEFLLVCRANEKYTYIDQRGTRFPVPVQTTGAAVKVVRHGDLLRYQVCGSETVGDLVIHAHGGLIHKTRITPTENTGMIDVSKFKSGIICLTLNNDKSETVSERLYYVDNSKENDDLSLDKSGDTLVIRNGTAELVGDFSVSVVPKTALGNPVLQQGLRASVLLQSDVSDPIINADYLVGEGADTVKTNFINLFLITQQWGRYVKDLSDFDLSFGKELNECVYGRVKGTRVKGVTLFGNTLDDVYLLDVDSKGYFYTDLPDFVGQTNFFVQPKTEKGKAIFAPVELRIEMFPEVKNNIKQLSSSKFTLKREVATTQHRVVQQREVSTTVADANNLWTLTIEPVAVQGKKTPPTREEAKIYYAATMLQADEVRRYSNFNIASAVNRLLGVSVWPPFVPNAQEYKVFSGRGLATIDGKVQRDLNDPTSPGFNPDVPPRGCEMTVYVDGVETPTTQALQMDPMQIKSIARLTLAESMTMAGARGFCGVISIKTKDPNDVESGNPIASDGFSFDKLGADPNLTPVVADHFISVGQIGKELRIAAPKTPGNYVVRIEGIDKEGNVVEKTFDLQRTF